jgi:hypothetical protein
MSQALFESKNWAATKEALTEGLSGQKKTTMEVCLENTKKYLTETATSGATASGNISVLNKVILPVIRRVMPTTIANELVGVQPMQGPVSQIHTLRVRYAEAASAASNARGVVGAAVTAGDEALSPFKIATQYSGNSAGQADTTATKEGTGGAKMSIQILKETVEAKSRKLSARWTFEAAQDAQAIHGVDVEAEIMAALAQEITAEIDQEIIESLLNLSGSAFATYDQSGVSGQASFGNYIVVSPTALTILQSATTSAFARTTEGTFEAPTNTKFVGTLNSSVRVYVNHYAGDDVPVLIGYKGANEMDAPAFYCPYIPLMSSGVILDPATFEPTVSFMTRYGYVELSNSASSLGNAADYVNNIAIDTSALSFI